MWGFGGGARSSVLIDRRPSSCCLCWCDDRLWVVRLISSSFLKAMHKHQKTRGGGLTRLVFSPSSSLSLGLERWVVEVDGARVLHGPVEAGGAGSG